MSHITKRCTRESLHAVPVPAPAKAQGKASFVIDKVRAMMRQEQTVYLYRRYVTPVGTGKYLLEDPDDLVIWREKICHWTYSVIDHFELSRKTVAVSINLFDRYLATQGNRCDGSLALLVSLTTLYIAIKVHEKKKIKLSTLTELSRCQFSSEDIEQMEVRILQSISWFVHPPTVVDFISHLLKFLPPTVPMPVRQNIYELSRYMAELSICNPFFLEHHPSTIAFASIINVLEYEVSFESVPLRSRSQFFRCLHDELGFHRGRAVVGAVRVKLEDMVAASGITRGQNKENSLPSSSYSDNIKDDISVLSTSCMSENTEMKSVKSSDNRSRCNSSDSRNSQGSTGSRRFRIHRRGSLITPCK